MLFINVSSASNDCIERTIWNNSICVSIDKRSNNTYKLNSDIDCNDNSCSVSCWILRPDNVQEDVWRCNGSFSYNSNSSEKVRIYIKLWNNPTQTIEAYYDFRNGNRWNEIDNNDNLKLSASTTSPNVWSWTKLYINTDRNYEWRISFDEVQYRSKSSNSRTTITDRTSSTYFSDYSNERRRGYYTMNDDDNGRATISNFLKFAKKGYYKISIKDTDWNRTSITFNVWGSSTSSNNLSISAASTNVSTSQFVKLYINTDDDYDGKINFSLKYRSTSSSSRSTISNLKNVTYVSDYSTDWDNGYYRMRYNDNGNVTLSDLVKFKKTGYYQITAEDVNWETDSVEIHVTTNWYDYDYLELSADNRSPKIGNYVKLYINTDDDYVWKIYFDKIEYKSNSSSSRTSISSRTNTRYFTGRSREWSGGYYNMVSSDNGEATISNFLKFVKTGYYKIYAKDKNWVDDYILFNVWEGSSSNDDLSISTNEENPSTNEYINLIIETDDDYVWKVYLTAQYKSSSNSTRRTISGTDSSYFSNISTAWSDWYVTLTSSNNGYKRIGNALKFKKEWYYKITATDKYDNSESIEFDVWWSSSSTGRIRLETDDDSPAASSYVDLTVLAPTSFRWKINFSAKYKSSSNGTRRSISRTDSDYFLTYSTTWRNWYINMTASDDGEKTIWNIFKFAQKWYYRIYAEDDDNEYSQTYIEFSVWNPESSPLEWFTQKEYETVVQIYNVWPSLLSNLKNKYPRLKTNSTWQTRSNTLKNNMKDVIDKKTNRTFQDYEDFYEALTSWLVYTQRLIK